MKVLVIGAGNPLRSDDGIGHMALQRLQRESALTGARLEEIGTDGLALIDLVRTHEGPIALVDAMDMGIRPGETRVFRPEDVRMRVKSDSLSTHGLGLADVLQLMEALHLKVDLTLIGMQPESLDYGEKLSQSVSSQFEELLKTIMNFVNYKRRGLAAVE